MTTFHVTECFDSIQGEGALAGMPSTFIRLAHCNLACSWCDAAYTWKGDVRFDECDLETLLDRVRHDYVVLTGGEPTFADGFDELTYALHTDGLHVTVETNGTLLREAALENVSLWSLSPKLGSSGQAPFLRMDVVERYLRDGRGAQLKYVADNDGDLDAIVAHLNELGRRGIDFDKVPVFMQPNGLCHIAAVRGTQGNVLLTDTAETREASIHMGEFGGWVKLETPYLDRVRWLYERVVELDQQQAFPCPVRAVVQAHKLAWGNRRGF